jgi:hypothetical protein
VRRIECAERSVLRAEVRSISTSDTKTARRPVPRRLGIGRVIVREDAMKKIAPQPMWPGGSLMGDIEARALAEFPLLGLSGHARTARKA